MEVFNAIEFILTHFLFVCLFLPKTGLNVGLMCLLQRNVKDIHSFSLPQLFSSF